MSPQATRTDRFVCVHAHLYQPPRENPWLESIEVQDSAYPYHDWNERISAECYAPNGWARLLDDKDRIRRITNNYSLMSFNVGPTLLSWMEAHAPEPYARILEGDRESLRTRRGHGNAIAQAYNHMILPLANLRDKVTQVRWGIADFVHRFQRKPEGMWLPETAVDEETLLVLAAHGIRFTILSPSQGARIRPLLRGNAHAESTAAGNWVADDPNRPWQDVSGSRIDPSRAYRHELPSGRSIDLFFYDGPISHAVAFEGLLDNGETFARRILGGLVDGRTWPQLAHIATDGESYGHHHRFGEMALAYALDRIERSADARLTNYGLFLEENAPTHEVRIIEPSSWSCAHGVERWRSDCGCNLGGHPAWNQRWRTVMRDALDWLRDRIDPFFEQAARAILDDPWGARDDYIAVILDRSPENVDSWLARVARTSLDPAEKVRVLQLLETQRQRMLAYTSCGWFFDDISGLESVQVLRHAARALQLARRLGLDLETEFVRKLAAARSNVPEIGDGAAIYEKLVRPSSTDLDRTIAHHALVASVGQGRPATEGRIYCFGLRQEDWAKESYGEGSLCLGKVEVVSRITRSTRRATFGVLHYGGLDFHCAVGPDLDGEAHERVGRELFESFQSHRMTDVVRALDRNLGTRYFGLRNMFLDERRQVVGKIAEEERKGIEETYRMLYEEHRRLMDYLRESDVPVPRGFLVLAEYVLRKNLQAAVVKLTTGGPLEPIAEILAEAKRWWLKLDTARVERILRRAVEERIQRLFAQLDPNAQRVEIESISTLMRAAEVAEVHLNLWLAQNLFCARWSAGWGDARSFPEIQSLGEKLGFGREILQR